MTSRWTWAPLADAATVAGINLTAETIEHLASRAATVKLSVDDLCAFEFAINDARTGDLRKLFAFFRMHPPRGLSAHCDFYLDEDWRDQLPEVEKLIAWMEAHQC
jgi:hypothetical protein